MRIEEGGRAVGVRIVRDGRRLRGVWEERLVREPRELCFDARDECATCGKPVVTPANECEQFFQARDLSHDTHDVDAMTKIEECGTVRTLRVMNALGNQMTERRERRADATARGVQGVTIEDLIEARTQRKRVGRDITKRLHWSGLADAPCFPRGVFDGLGFRPDELAQELVAKASPICSRAHTRVGLQRVCRGMRELFQGVGSRDVARAHGERRRYGRCVLPMTGLTTSHAIAMKYQ